MRQHVKTFYWRTIVACGCTTICYSGFCNGFEAIGVLLASQLAGANEAYLSTHRRQARLSCAPTLWIVPVWYMRRTNAHITGCWGRGATSSNGNRAVGAPASVRLSRAKQTPSEPSPSPGAASVCSHAMCRVRMVCGTNARSKYLSLIHH